MQYQTTGFDGCKWCKRMSGMQIDMQKKGPAEAELMLLVVCQVGADAGQHVDEAWQEAAHGCGCSHRQRARRTLHKGEAVKRRRAAQGNCNRRVGPPSDGPQCDVADRNELGEFEQQEPDVYSDGAHDGLPVFAPGHRLVAEREMVDTEERK